MKLLINTRITIVKPVKNKNFGYYTTFEKKKPDVLSIKVISASGRKRGAVGEITRDGRIETDQEVFKFITSQTREKINLVLDLVFGVSRTNNCSLIKKGIVNSQKISL